MAKNVNDEYYTDSNLAEYCVNKTKEVLGLEENTVYLEPSAGGGSFLDYLPNDTKALDTNPQDPRVTLGDFLEDTFEYKKGLCVIGNPPFGSRNTLAVKFFKKAVTLGDYVSFILPISQLENQQQMFEFDLVYSEDLGVRPYSGVDVHCCFNIYKRPEGGVHKKKPNCQVEGLTIKEFRRGCTDIEKFDKNFNIGLCTWGNLGKEPTFLGEFSQEHYLYIEHEKKEEILQYLRELDWLRIKPFTSTPKIQSWFLNKLILDFLNK